MKKFLVAVLFSFFIPLQDVLCQGELPVDMYTGSPSIQVPLYTLTDHDLAHAVSLNYNAGGIKPEESSGIAGIGWQMISGGSVTREVRGLPDDFSGTGSDLRKGWCYTSGSANAVHTMSNSADLSASTCSDELSDYTTIASFNANADTEPDIFHYNIGGFSGKFILDKNLNVRMMPLRDVKIELVLPDQNNSKIVSFTITTNDGIIYSFYTHVNSTQWTEKASGITTVQFLKRNFDLYDLARYNAKVTYTSEWKLSQIQSPSGAFIIFNYLNGESMDSRDTVRVAIQKNSSPDFIVKDQYFNRSQGTKLELSSIRGSSETMVNFTYTDNLLTSISVRDLRRGAESFKYFDFDYENIISSGSSFSRKFLTSLSAYAECDRLPPYKFTYTGVDLTTHRTSLPRAYSKNKDFWGYYNGKSNTTLIPKVYVYPALPPRERYRLHPISGYGGVQIILNGADRTPGGYSTEMGSLKTIVYPGGGSTTINYESNQYYDETAAQNFFGGGLRLKSAIYFDGINPQANIVKEFTYEELPNISSGRLISKPAFAIPVWEYRDPLNAANTISYTTLAGGAAQALWEHLTVRTEVDISSGETSHGNSVGYKMVKVARPGSGSAIFEFHMPGIFGESLNGDWEATQNKFVRGINCPVMNIVNEGGADALAFSPDPFYDYARGLLWRKRELNEAGIKVREAISTYQYLYKTGIAPVKVWGLHYDHYPNAPENIYFFGKYFQLTDVDKVLSTETVTVYDESDANKSLTDVSEYFYESNFHKLLTKVRKTNSDGTIYTAKTKYPLDYSAIPDGADKASEMIGWLQGNFRNGISVEQISTLQKIGEPEKIVSASLTLFDNFGSTDVLPKSILSLSLAAPISSFTQSYVDVTTKAFTYDPAYEVVQTNLAFDSYGKPLSVKGINPVVTSTHWGYSKTLPVVIATGVEHDQFAFSDFETTTGYGFAQSANRYGSGRTGKNGLYPQVLLTKTLKKADAQNYVLSFWFKKLSAALSFRVVIKNVTGTTTYYDDTFSVSPSGSDYEHIEKIIPASSFPETFLIEFQGQLTGTLPGSGPSLLPLIDDVAFYPEKAELTTFTYETPFGVNSVTDARGVTAYTQYDYLGRVKYVLDQDKNILQKNTYEFAAVPITLSKSIELPNVLLAGWNLKFRSVGNECIDGETYAWNFGSGFVSTGTIGEAFRVYNTPGHYTVSVRVSHPNHDEVTGSISFDIVSEPLNIAMCAKGVYEYNDCGLGTVSTYNCTGITSAPPILGTIFKAQLEFDDSVPTYTYKWYKRNLNSATWTQVGTANQYTGQLSPPFKSYVVKCVVTTSNGRSGETQEYAVFVNCGEVN